MGSLFEEAIEGLWNSMHEDWFWQAAHLRPWRRCHCQPNQMALYIDVYVYVYIYIERERHICCCCDAFSGGFL